MSHSHDVFSGYSDGPSWIVPCKSVKIVLPLHFAWEVGKHENSTKIKAVYHLRSAISDANFCKSSFSTEMSHEALKIFLRIENSIISFLTTAFHQVHRSKKHSNKPTSHKLATTFHVWFSWSRDWSSEFFQHTYSAYFTAYGSSFTNLGHLWHFVGMIFNVIS